jgi:cysteine desulfurase
MAHGSIRFSLCKYTTESDIRYTINTVKEVVSNFRKISPFKEQRDMDVFMSEPEKSSEM